MALDRPIREDAPKVDPNRIWDQAERRKLLERMEEEEVFALSPEELKKCRFQLSTDPYERDLGMAECTVHVAKSTHGVRLFPKHLWNIRSDGTLEYKTNASSPWKTFTPKSRKVVDKKKGVK